MKARSNDGSSWSSRARLSTRSFVRRAGVGASCRSESRWCAWWRGAFWLGALLLCVTHGSCTIRHELGPLDCSTGIYAGSYRCDLSIGGQTRIQWSGPVTLAIDEIDDDLVVASIDPLEAVDSRGGSFRARIEGRCDLGVLSAELVEATYTTPGIEFAVEGAVGARYDSSSLVEGVIGPLSTPGLPSIEYQACQWSARRQ